MTAGGTGPVDFDPFDPAFIESPYEQYAVLRDQAPVHHSELLCGWLVTRFDDVAALLRDPTVSSSVLNAAPTRITEIELASLAEHPRASRTMVQLDDPDHARIRRLMAEPFRVRQVSRLGELVEARIQAALDRLRTEHGDEVVEVDLIGDFAYPLPVEIFSGWLGVPEEAGAQFRVWTSWVARSRDPMRPGERDEMLANLDAMYAYLEERAEEKRRQPADDLLTYLVHAEDGGDTLSHDELMAQLVTLYMAGHEPVAGLVGNAVLALSSRPDQVARLRAEPDLMRNAVSELLRFDGPNQFVRRVLTEPATIGGVDLPAGAVVYPGLASANRDPRRWGPTAEEVHVDRADAGQHLQFGGGAHACIGAHLARLQAERFLGAVLGRMEDLELAGEPVWSTRMFIRGLSSLPVRCRITA